MRSKRFGLELVSGGEKEEGGFGLTHARCGIYTWCDRKSDIVFAKLMLTQAQLHNECANTWALRFAKNPKPEMREHSVLPGEGDQVSDRRERDHIKKPLLPSIGNINKCFHLSFFAFKKRRVSKLERDSRTAEVAIRVPFDSAQGRHHLR